MDRQKQTDRFVSRSIIHRIQEMNMARSNFRVVHCVPHDHTKEPGNTMNKRIIILLIRIREVISDR